VSLTDPLQEDQGVGLGQPLAVPQQRVQVRIGMPAVPFPDFGGLAAAHALGSPNQAAADVEEIHEPVPGRGMVAIVTSSEREHASILWCSSDLSIRQLSGRGGLPPAPGQLTLRLSRCVGVKNVRFR
jgi:hypothetical protein